MNLLLIVCLSCQLEIQCPIQQCQTSTLIRERIYFSEAIYSRCIVNAVLPSGKLITVPIINGYMPSIRITYLDDGSVLREYDYDSRDVYLGGVIQYPAKRREPPKQKYELELPKQKMPKFSDEDFEVIQKDVELLRNSMRALQENDKKIIPPVLNLGSSKKKPSEFGR